MFAHQTEFTYGWDYVGEEDGKRMLFDTREEAEQDLRFLIKEMNYDPEEWRVVEYIEINDSKGDLEQEETKPEKPDWDMKESDYL